MHGCSVNAAHRNRVLQKSSNVQSAAPAALGTSHATIAAVGPSGAIVGSSRAHKSVAPNCNFSSVGLPPSSQAVSPALNTALGSAPGISSPRHADLPLTACLEPRVVHEANGRPLALRGPANRSLHQLVSHARSVLRQMAQTCGRWPCAGPQIGRSTSWCHTQKSRQRSMQSPMATRTPLLRRPFSQHRHSLQQRRTSSRRGYRRAGNALTIPPRLAID